MYRTINQRITEYVYEGLGHGIIAVAAPGMASKNTTDGKIQAFEGAMLAEYLKGILGTCGGETARWAAFQRRQAHLIEPDKKDKRCYGDFLQHRLRTSSVFTFACHTARITLLAHLL